MLSKSESVAANDPDSNEAATAAEALELGAWDCETLLLVDSATKPAELSADSSADETIWLIATPAATALVSGDAIEAEATLVPTAGSTLGEAIALDEADDWGEAITSKLAIGATSGAGGWVIR